MILENTLKTPEIGRESQGNSDNYVTWKGTNVEIPQTPYNAGGRPVDYNSDKTLSTLNFFYKHFMKNDLNEARLEFSEEKHAKELFDISLSQAIEDTQTNQDLNKILIGRQTYLRNEQLYKLLGLDEQSIESA